MILCIQLKLTYGRNYYVLWICFDFAFSLHITSNHGSLIWGIVYNKFILCSAKNLMYQILNISSTIKIAFK